MANLKWVRTVTLRGGREFKVGDKVEPIRGKKREMEKYLEEPAPYEISRIGVWPCGGVNLYFKMFHGRKPGAEAMDFVRV